MARDFVLARRRSSVRTRSAACELVLGVPDPALHGCHPLLKLLRDGRLRPDSSPGSVGLVSGLITGLALRRMGAIGAVVLGKFADVYGMSTMMTACSFLPILGLLTLALPKDAKSKKATA